MVPHELAFLSRESSPGPLWAACDEGKSLRRGEQREARPHERSLRLHAIADADAGAAGAVLPALFPCLARNGLLVRACEMRGGGGKRRGG